MIKLVLEDSQLDPGPAKDHIDEKSLGLVERAVSALNEEVYSERIVCFSFSGKRRDSKLPELIRAYPTAVRVINGSRWIVSTLSFSTSHYVGQASLKIDGETVKIIIKPRFAQCIWDHILQCATRVYLPERLTSSGMSFEGDTEWLLLLMWRHAFERAMRECSVPKAYVHLERNLRFFRGRLNVTRHLRENLTDQSRFYCVFDKLSFDNTINRTIRSVYRILASSNMPAKACASISEHDDRLASLGVGNGGVTIQEISAIKYTRMNEAYRPVMALSQIILRGYGAGEFGGDGSGPSYFVDVSEIWESYLLSVMKRRVEGYSFVSPNDEDSGVWLLNGARRSLRPDFLVYDRSGRIVAVMDAKYKKYERIGRYSTENNAVSREDLYQMATYMYRFGDATAPLAGIFISPFSIDCDEGIIGMGNNSKHFMNVCNLPIMEFNRSCKEPTEEASANEMTSDRTHLLEKLNEMEVDFASRLKKCLDLVSARSLGDVLKAPSSQAVP